VNGDRGNDALAMEDGGVDAAGLQSWKVLAQSRAPGVVRSTPARRCRCHPPEVVVSLAKARRRRRHHHRPPLSAARSPPPSPLSLWPCARLLAGHWAPPCALRAVLVSLCALLLHRLCGRRRSLARAPRSQTCACVAVQDDVMAMVADNACSMLPATR